MVLYVGTPYISLGRYVYGIYTRWKESKAYSQGWWSVWLHFSKHPKVVTIVVCSGPPYIAHDDVVARAAHACSQGKEFVTSNDWGAVSKSHPGTRRLIRSFVIHQLRRSDILNGSYQDYNNLTRLRLRGLAPPFRKWYYNITCIEGGSYARF